MNTLCDALEGRQIGIYLAAVGAAVAVALMLPFTYDSCPSSEPLGSQRPRPIEAIHDDIDSV